MIALGGPPPEDLIPPDDFGVMEIRSKPILPVWPFTTRAFTRRIGWVLWEVYGFRVSRRMVYARTDEQ